MYLDGGEGIIMRYGLFMEEEGDETEASKYRVEGNELQDHGRYAEAIPLYQKAIELEPSSASSWLGLGNCHSKLRNFGELRDVGRMCISIDPTLIEGYVYVATAEKALMLYKNALETVKRGLALDPDIERLRSFEKTLQDSFKHQRLFKEGKITIPDRAPRALGGFHFSNEEVLARMGSHLAELHRPPMPPPLRRTKVKEFTDDRAKIAFDTLYFGEYKVRWYTTDTDFELQAYLTDDPSPVLRWDLSGPGGSDSLDMLFFTEQNPTYHRLWTLEQKEFVACRVLLRFLRQHAVTVCGCVPYPCSPLVKIIATLRSHCASRNLSNDLVDVTMIAADVYAMIGQSQSSHLIELAWALESADRVDEATRIFFAAAERTAGESSPGGCKADKIETDGSSDGGGEMKRTRREVCLI